MPNMPESFVEQTLHALLAQCKASRYVFSVGSLRVRLFFLGQCQEA